MVASVLQKEALKSLFILYRDASHTSFQTGCIQEYDPSSDCFIVWNDESNQQVAIQFKQFLVEQANTGQLVLRVPTCTHKPLPALYQNGASGTSHARATGSSAGPSSHGSLIGPQGSQQLSAVLSQQLSGLIGRCFSHTEDGFEVASPDQLPAAVDADTTGDGAAAMQCEQQQVGLQIHHRPSRHSTDSALDDGSYWGSPVKHDSTVAHTAAAAFAAAAGGPSKAGTSSAGGHEPEQQQNSSAAGSLPIPVAMRRPSDAGNAHTAAAAAAAGVPNGLSSFQEISRMISQGEDNSPMVRPGNIKTSLAPGHAARLLDEQGSWGTPQENSPWGTPREQQMGSNTSNTPTSSIAEQPGQQHSHHPSGSALHKLMFGGEQLHSRLEAVVSADQEQPQQQGQQLDSSQGAGPADVLGAPRGAGSKPAVMADTAMDLEPAEVVAAAVAAVDAAAASEADTFGDMDFTIPVAMDVQPRPQSRNSSRFREMYRAGSASGNTGVAVDVPQPLSARHGNLLRSPGRSLPAPSDPGHMGMPSAFSNAASIAVAQVSASAGGSAFEQRRTSTNIGAGLGGSHAASRRMSRNASSRLNADQDWALLGPDGQILQPQLIGLPAQQQQQQQQRVSLGQVLHAPAVVSRRASRTLSGRLALDQDMAAVLMEQLDDAEPDVLSRPVAPAAPGLDTIVSRRQSTSNGRGTPDSDGFGFSEFEGLEPLVPPEEAAAAALTEAAAAAAAAASETAVAEGSSAGGANGVHHHRAHRRSARSLGMSPVVNMSQRPSMRLSDQDPGHHGLAALPAMTAQAVAAAAAARAHASAAAGLPGPRVGSYDVLGTQPTALQPTEEEAAMDIDQEGGADGDVTMSGAGTGPATATPSRFTSRANSAGAAATGSPRQSGGTGASTRTASGSMNDGSRRSSKRSIPSIFQAAAAVAAAAEAAAAAAVGFALGGKDRTVSEQQAMDATPAAPAAAADEAAGAQQVEQLRDDSVLTANSFLRQRLAGDGLGSGFGSVDSFTCPPFMPLAGSVTATGGRAGSSANGSNGSSVVSSSNGSIQQGIPIPGAVAAAASPAAAATEAMQVGAVGNGIIPPYAATMAAAAAAAIAAEGDGHVPGLYGSPAANLGSYTGGSPSAAQAALLRRQQLMGGEGSEWGSGSLGPHLHLSTSGIDSPTGSAVFRLGGNSPHPMDACDSAGGGVSVAPGELSAALETLVVQAGAGAVGSTGASKPVGIGASRMAREAAAAAAGTNGPVGAAALLVGTQGVTGLSKGAAGLSEITPADEDDPGEDRISAKYPSDSGANQSAGAVFFRLAGDLAPGVPKIASAEVGGEQSGRGRSSSSGGGAAVSKVLGNIVMGQAALLTKPPQQANSSSGSQGGTGAATGAASSRGASTGSAGSSNDAAPPSYAESVGAEGDDEDSPHANRFAAISRRVWPAQFAASAQPGLGAGESAAAAVDHSSIRQSAALAGNPAQPETAAGADYAAPVSSQQHRSSEADIQPSTGLVRRTPHASRTPSQSLLAAAQPSIEGLGLLGGSSFHYGDEDGQPLFRASAVSSAGQGPNTLLEDRRTTGRVVLHAFVTLSAQWFDCMALVVLGPQLASALLPADMPQLQQLQGLFGIFAAGHMLWLLGCFLWPAKASKLGRKGLLAWTMGLSGCCTALMGCMPAYSEGGMAGVGILTALHFISGAAASNTAPAALVYLSDHAPQCPNLHASLVPASMAAGACGASGLALALSWVMNSAVLGASGWRVVLVLSLLSNTIAAGLRGWVLQEPEGQMQAAELLDRSNVHVGRILRHHTAEVLLAVLLQAFAASGLFLLTAWLPSYFMHLSGMATSTALLIHTLNMAALAGSMLLGGLLADEWAPLPVLLATCAVAIAFGWPAWLLFSLGVAEVTWFAQCILCVLVGLHWGALTEVLVDMFPTGMRSSALTVVHVVPMVALGSTAPLMALGFVAKTGSLTSSAFVNIIMAAVTFAAVVWQAWKSSAGLRF